MRPTDVHIGDELRVKRGTPLNGGVNRAGNATMCVVRQVWRKDRQALVEVSDSRWAFDLRTSVPTDRLTR